MARVRVYYDQAGNTLTVWFDDSGDEYLCEEKGDEIILMKNQAGKVIGFEKLNYAQSEAGSLNVAFEALSA